MYESASGRSGGSLEGVELEYEEMFMTWSNIPDDSEEDEQNENDLDGIGSRISLQKKVARFFNSGVDL